MKRTNQVVLLCIVGIFMLIGCSKTNENKGLISAEVLNEADTTMTPSPTQSEEQTMDENPVTKESQQDEEALKQREEELLDLAKESAEQMAALEFSSVVDRFADVVKAQLTEEVLSSTWKQMVMELGAYQSVYSQSIFSGGDQGTIVTTILAYEKKGLQVKFVFDTDNQISGLWLNYQIIENSESKNDTSVKEVDIKLGKGDSLLDGKLTLPQGISKPPVVILVQGSGQSDMDETIGAQGNKPFQDIAYGLAKRGIASIRYNKRYYQYADQATLKMTIQDEVLNDVRFAIDFLLSRQDVDVNQIIVLGHSLGGMLAPKIAKDNKEITRLISMAGSPRKLEDIIFDQVKDSLMQQEDMSEEDKNLTLAQYEQAVAAIKNLGEENLGEAILGVSGYYWKSLNDIDSAALAKELTIPMLFLQGSEDFQVYPEIDFKQWQETLAEKSNASFLLYEGLNHLFMKSNGEKNTTEYDTKGSVDARVLDDITVWITGIK